MYKEQQIRDLLAGRSILIAGYGREGKSSHALLQQLFPGEVFDIAQNNDEILSALEARHYDLIIKSPGIPTFVFEGHCDLNSLTSQTDLFLQVYGSQTIGITGTKGKSTTTSLIYHTLCDSGSQAILAGNIGIPLFDILPQVDADTWVVAEFSCHQLENIHRGPHIAVVLNLFQEHLDHYHNYEGYQLAKMQIALNQTAADYFFYCADNSDLVRMMEQCSGHIASHVASYSLQEASQSEVATLPSPLTGEHNLCNSYVAARMTSLCGVSQQQFAHALQTFRPLEHRLELVGTYQGITFYNDSISTIPAACIAAVTALKEVDTLILGGFDRGIDYNDLGRFLAASQIRNIAFVGAAGQRILAAYEQALGQQPQANCLVESDYNKIVPWCFEVTAPGKVCLLSPAAASYDAFKNFEERGTVYKQLVKCRM